jgi:predicted dienelactone hydrolase
MKKYLITCLLALVAACAQAGVGLAELPGLKGDGPVTVYYPSAGADRPLQRGPFALNLDWQGQPVRGNGRLVVVSHGSGGAPWVHADLARALVDAGFVVAMPEHHGDNYKDISHPGPESWKLRPAEVSRAIDAVAQDPRFAPLLAIDKVGVYGGSAGGHTVLELAGGRWSPAGFRRHCDAHIAEDFSSCVGFTLQLHGNMLDGIKKAVALAVIHQRFDDATWHGYTDPRIQAALAIVPFAADFDPASLATPHIPLGLIAAGQDVNQVPRFHSGFVRASCKTCELVADLPTAGHGVMLSPMPPMNVLGPIEQDLLGDPPGFDRAAVVPELDRKIVAFFRAHLLP